MSAITDTGYLLLAAIAVVLALLGRRAEIGLSPVRAHVSAIMRTPAARAVVLVLWWWVGWHFFVR